MSENHDAKSSNERKSKSPRQTLVLFTILGLTIITVTSNVLYAKNGSLSRTVSPLPILGVLLMLILTEWKGRRLLFITLFILSLISSLTHIMCEVFAYSMADIICQILHAPVQGSAIALLYVVICEYCDPKRRLFYLAANSSIQILFYWITLGFNSSFLMMYYDWLFYGNITLGVLGLWSAFKFPESPYWLASRRRYEESASAFIEIRGEGSESSEELRELTEAKPRPGSFKMFLTPSLLALPVMFMTIPSVDTVDILREYYNFISINDTIQYNTNDLMKKQYFGPYLILLLAKCIAVVASLITVLILVKLPRKLLFVSCGFIFLSELLFIHSVNFSNPVYLLILDTILDYGPRIVSLPLLIEIIPQKFASLVTVSITLIYVTVDNVIVYNPEHIVFAPVVLGMVFIAYFFMPEARDKTLIEIEQLYVSDKNKPPQPIHTDL